MKSTPEEGAESLVLLSAMLSVVLVVASYMFMTCLDLLNFSFEISDFNIEDTDLLFFEQAKLVFHNINVL